MCYNRSTKKNTTERFRMLFLDERLATAEELKNMPSRELITKFRVATVESVHTLRSLEDHDSAFQREKLQNLQQNRELLREAIVARSAQRKPKDVEAVDTINSIISSSDIRQRNMQQLLELYQQVLTDGFRILSNEFQKIGNFKANKAKMLSALNRRIK